MLFHDANLSEQYVNEILEVLFEDYPYKKRVRCTLLVTVTSHAAANSVRNATGWFRCTVGSASRSPHMNLCDF